MKKEKSRWLEDLMAAIAFAEAGDHDYAVRLVNTAKAKRLKRKRVSKRPFQHSEERPQMRI